MGRLIAVVNQKGGVGKTTTTVNTGCALADEGQSVALVDLDANGDLTAALGHEPDDLAGRTIFDVAVTRELTIEEIRIQTEHQVHLYPANEDLATAEIRLLAEFYKNGRDWRTALRGPLATLRDAYQYVLLDCPPNLGIWTVAALAAADEVLVPVSAEYLPFRALSRLMDSINLARREFNSTLTVTGIVPTMYDARTSHAKEVLGEIRDTYPDVRVFQPIHTSVRFREAPIAGVPTIRYAQEVARPYREIAQALIASN